MRLVANNAENFVVEVHGVKIKKWYIDKFLNIYQQNALPNYKKIMMKIYQKKARGESRKRGGVCASELGSLELIITELPFRC